MLLCTCNWSVACKSPVITQLYQKQVAFLLLNYTAWRERESVCVCKPALNSVMWCMTNEEYEVIHVLMLTLVERKIHMECLQVLLNHVVAGDLTSTAIKAVLGEAGGSTIVPTLLGSDLFVSTVDEGLYVQSRGLEAPGALVVTPDIPTCVGPVHVIDKVLLPADADDMIVMFSGEPAAEEVCCDVPSLLLPFAALWQWCRRW